jgi:anti-sigma B factor antagonist
MSDHAGATSIRLERNGQAMVAQPQVKMMDDDALRALTRMVDEVATPDSGVGSVVIDLSRVAILPSLALGRLVEISNHCKHRGLGLTLVGLRPQIRQVFAITRLDQVFRFAETVEDATKD